MLIDCKKKNVFRTHGMTKTITYKSWQCLIQRCLNKNNQRYKEYYGQKGINVCDRWNVAEGGGFENFFEDMGERPAKNYTLDRIDNSKGYYKENCRWADKTVQAINRNISSKNTSGVKGVYWRERDKLWVASMKINKVNILYKLFKNKEDAIKARQEAEEKYFKPILEGN